ncbi:MAG: integrase catalytic domain-containing protein [Fidelibacterota bacterium]
MKTSMSFKSKRELLIQIKARYAESSPSVKKLLLDEFTAYTGYKRNYAIHLLNNKKDIYQTTIHRKRIPKYGSKDAEIIKLAWTATNFIGSKRLAPFLCELIPSLERHGYLELTDAEREKITQISAATIDRMIQCYRNTQSGRGLSTTKSGSLLKHRISLRTFSDWNEVQPGFFEANLVAHCGQSAAGTFLFSLVLTDVNTGWTECLAIPNKSQDFVIQAIKACKKLNPYPLLGIDTDNGTEFINNEFIDYCEKEKITFTRGRAYKKNDQCFVEQKNGTIVRQLVGYDRYEGLNACHQMNELYRAIRLFVNFFQPSMKLKIKHRNGCHEYRKYDQARTPYHRTVESSVLSPEIQTKLHTLFESIDPVQLLQHIRQLQDALWKHVVTLDKVQNMPLITFERGNKSLNEKSTEFIKSAVNDETRRYRRKKATRVPHTWRTRKDPFEKVREEIKLLYEGSPEITSKQILEILQREYPGKYPDKLLRTLQRKVKALRKTTALVYDYQWLDDNDPKQKTDAAPKLKGVISHEADFPK